MSSYSYFIDLRNTDNFGEIGFFTDKPRMITAKSRDYCELYCLHKKDFLKIAEDYIHAIVSITTIYLLSIEKSSLPHLKLHIVSLSHNKNSIARRGELLCNKLEMLYLQLEGSRHFELPLLP
jgi:CRP-like cAMP-binding protein